MSGPLDLSDRLAVGSLPDDPFDSAEPYEPKPDSPRRPARSIVTVDATEIARPLPALSYLVPSLGIASGAPVLVAGYGFSGKTVSLQSLALSVASGRPLWGVYSVREGRVRHFDFEQGSRVSHERYQRLARGMGIDLAGLGDRLTLAVNPAAYLDDDDAEEAYARAFEGVDLAIVDSLRAAAPTFDENSSEIRRPIDLAFRAAELHGTIVVFIHHARKPKSDDPAGARYKIRGSSALFDAGGSTFLFAAEKDQPTRVTHEKCRNRGITVDDFGLRVEDVEIDGDARAGLRVVHLEREQLAKTEACGRNAYSEAMDRVASFLRAEGEFRGTKTAVRERIRMGRDQFFAAIGELESRGEAVIGKDERGAFVRWVGVRPDASADDSGRNRTGDSPVPSDPQGCGTGRDER